MKHGGRSKFSKDQEGRKISMFSDELIWDERILIKARNSVERGCRGPGLNRGGVPTLWMGYNKRIQEGRQRSPNENNEMVQKFQGGRGMALPDVTGTWVKPERRFLE